MLMFRCTAVQPILWPTSHRAMKFCLGSEFSSSAAGVGRLCGCKRKKFSTRLVRISMSMSRKHEQKREDGYA
jgi:hypothetical protein